MTAISYAGTDWATAFGSMPEPPGRTITPILGEGGQVNGETHVITLTGWMEGSGATALLQQIDLAAKVAVLEALGHDGALIYDDNAGDAIWAYDDSTQANNHVTLHGLKVEIIVPTGDVADLTNRPYTVILTGEVARCTNDPIAGIGSLSYSIQETYDRSGLVTVSYSGSMCACDGSDGKTVLDDLILSVFTPDAFARFVSAGFNPPATFTWTSMTRTSLDRDGKCWSFTVTYGEGQTNDSTVNVQWSLTIIQNLIELVINGIYRYRRRRGTPGSTFSAVHSDAMAHQGINYRDFLPSGAGTLIDVVQTRLDGSDESLTITSSKTYRLNWIHDDAIVLYDELVSIQLGQRAASFHVLSPTPSVPVPLPYPQRSGLSVSSITFNIRLVAADAYKEIPWRLTPDGLNIFSDPGPRNRTYKQVDPTQGTGTAVGGSRHWFETSETQTFFIVDINASGIPRVRIGSVSNLGVVGAQNSQFVEGV